MTRLFINCLMLCIILLLASVCTVVSLDVIYAINAGGEQFIDSYGIQYDSDPLFGKIGIPSDYGKSLLIGRVPESDQILYQTERYHQSTFGYDIPISSDGDYVMVLKFCEVYFENEDRKVFDVVLNGDHTIVKDLDIFKKVGKGVAHEEYISFSVSRGRLYWDGADSDIRGGKIRVEFLKGFRDNPKINAIYVIRGNIEDVPKLPALSEVVVEELKGFELTNEEEAIVTKSRLVSGPPATNPYTIEDPSLMLPVFVAIGAFIPLLFCLCKL